MKISSILLVIIFALQSCAKEKTEPKIEKGDVPEVAVSAQANDRVIISSKEDIRKYYTGFREEAEKKILDSAYFEYKCDGNDGNVTYYFKGSKLKIIKHNYTEYSHFSAEENFYIADDKPFFILKKETAWSFKGKSKEKPETKDDITEYRIYIINGKVADCLEKKYSIHSAEKNKPDPSKIINKKSEYCKSEELISEFEKLMKYKNSKKHTEKCL